MKIRYSLLALSLLSSTVMAATTPPMDYAASIVEGGINLYSYTGKGSTLVKGSPFVPNPVPIGTVTNGREPLFVTLSPSHKELFAYYLDPYEITSLLVAFHVTPQGLIQYWEHNINIGVGGNHGASPQELVATDGQVYITYVPGESPLHMGVYALGHAGNFVMTYEGAIINGYQDLEQLQSTHFDPDYQYYSLCLQRVSGETETITAEYVKIFSYSTGKLLHTNMNTDFYNAVCM